MHTVESSFTGQFLLSHATNVDINCIAIRTIIFVVGNEKVIKISAIICKYVDFAQNAKIGRRPP